MVKEKRILSYFIGWLLLGFIVCFIGLSNTYASEIIIPGSVQFYDNSGSSVSSVETFLENNSYYATFTTTEDGYGGLITFQLNTVLQKGRIYTIFILGGAESNGGTTRPSSKKYIGIGSNISNANSSYINSTNPASYSASSGTTADTSRGVYYTFVANQTGPYIAVPYTTQYTCSNCRQYFSGYTLEDLGSSENLSQDEVNNIINSQTAIIQNNINNMEQSIVDSNKETQDVIKDQFNDCNQNLISKSMIEYGSLANSSGNNALSSSKVFVRLKSKLNVQSGIEYNFKISPSKFKYLRFFTYDSSGNYLNYINININTGTITFNNDVSYIRFNLTIDETTEITQEDFNSLEVFFGSEEICSNKIDETNDKLDGIQGALTDSSSPDTSGLNDSAGWLPAGPLDSVLNLPLSLFNALTTNLNKSCNPINIPLPFVNKNITLPCINTLYNQIGITSFLSWIGVIVSGLMLYTYLLKLYKWIEDRISLNETHNVDNWGGL